MRRNSARNKRPCQEHGPISPETCARSPLAPSQDAGGCHADRRAEGNQAAGIPRRADPGGGARICGGRTRGRGRDAGRRRHRRRRRNLPEGGRADRPDRRRHLRLRRDGREGEGAAAGRMEAAPRRADPFHLPASRARSGPDEGPDGIRLHGRRLRDGDRRSRRAASAGADERGGGPPGDRSGRHGAEALQRRTGDPPRRRARRAAGAGRRARRRRRRHACRADGRRAGRGGQRPRPFAAEAARARRTVPGPGQDALLDASQRSRTKSSRPTS